MKGALSVLRLLKSRREEERESVKRECRHEWEEEVLGSERCAVCGDVLMVYKLKRCRKCGERHSGWEWVKPHVKEGTDRLGEVLICFDCLPKFKEVEQRLEELLGPTPAYDLELAFMGTPVIFWSLASLRKWLSDHIAYRGKLSKIHNSQAFGNITGYVFDAIPKDPIAKPYVVMIPIRVIAEEARVV